MPKTKLPGLKAKHRIITDSCRARGKGVAIDEALQSLKEEYSQLVDVWPEGDGHKFHVVLTIENANRD